MTSLLHHFYQSSFLYLSEFLSRFWFSVVLCWHPLSYRLSSLSSSFSLLGPNAASCPQTASPLPPLRRRSVLFLSVSCMVSPVSSLCQPPLPVDLQSSLHCLQADQNCQVLFCSSSPVTFKTPQFCNCLLYRSHFLILFFNRQN